MRIKPAIFIPTLYFAEGLPYTIVNLMAVVFFKNLGASNAFIGWSTSFLAIPWTLKFLWSPLIDVYGTKKRWVVVAQMVLGGLVALLAVGCFLPDTIYVSVAIFLTIAVASATHDIAIDGYYMDVLNKEQQAYYVGIRNAAYKVAWLLGSGALVFLAGHIAETNPDLGVKGGWFVSYLVCALLLLLCGLFHRIALPDIVDDKSAESADKNIESAHEYEAEEKPQKPKLGTREFVKVFFDFLDQPKIAATVTYILIFRLGDALMLKMAQPFLLDDLTKGGLALKTSEVGIIYGTVGMLFLLAGGIFGGFLVSKYGLKKCLLPTAIIQNGAIILYWWLAHIKPSAETKIFGLNLETILPANEFLTNKILYTTFVNSIEQFSYGLGVAAYTVFLLSTVKKDYKAAHYAIATALMAMGLLIPGAISGNLQEAFGYEKFFLISFLVSIPGIITIFFLPLDEPKGESKSAV